MFALTISLSQCTFAASSFSNSQINTASASVKNFVDQNDRLPNYVTISKTKVTMPQFLDLMANNVQNIKSGTKKSVTPKTISSPTSNSENIKIGNIKKSEYLSMSQSIKTTTSSTKKAPSSLKASIGTVGYKNLVYSYSKVLTFYKTNNRLPNYVTVNPFPDKLGWTSVSYTYHHQTTEYTCGPSTLKMALSHYGINASETWLAKVANSNYYTGTSQSGMAAAVKAVNAKYGTKFSTTTEKFTGWNIIQAYLAKGAPVIVRCRSWTETYGSHYVVITGINLQTGKVRLGDSSYNGKGTFSVKDKGVKIHEVTMQDLQNRINWMVNTKGISKPLLPIVKS